MAKLELDVFLEGQNAPIGRLSRNDDGATAFRYLSDQLAQSPTSQKLMPLV
jgi:hypothetical protein